MREENINRITSEFLLSNELLNNMAVTPESPVAQKEYTKIPRISETFKHRLVKTDKSLASKVIMFDIENRVVLVGKSSFFKWKIFSPSGDKVGELVRNFYGSEYLLSSNTTTECFIKYVNVYSNAGPRIFHVYKNQLLPEQNGKHNKTISERVKNKTNQYVKLINKPPYFNYDTNSFVLNFNGRVTLPSARNFQVVHPKDVSYITLTFGKIAHNEYILDYSYPWCALDAFSVALTSFSWRFGL
ncbi:tubby [Nematocida sp. AWRm78]|nr:tubby [Nematocida sp. AWRm79]KAI5183150.1 tubby [Nematocida sp. AWRm78]